MNRPSGSIAVERTNPQVGNMGGDMEGGVGGNRLGGGLHSEPPPSSGVIPTGQGDLP